MISETNGVLLGVSKTPIIAQLHWSVICIQTKLNVRWCHDKCHAPDHNVSVSKNSIKNFEKSQFVPRLKQQSTFTEVSKETGKVDIWDLESAFVELRLWTQPVSNEAATGLKGTPKHKCIEINTNLAPVLTLYHRRSKRFASIHAI